VCLCVYVILVELRRQLILRARAPSRLAATVDKVNEIVVTYQPAGVDWTVSPEDGNVAFGSGACEVVKRECMLLCDLSAPL
jgi:hypothetical protein